MMMSDDDLRAICQHRSTDVPSTRSACLTEAEWARLLSKEAAGAERARAAAHIASCTECADEYRLLQPLQAWAADVERVLSPTDAVHGDGSTGWHAWFSSRRAALAMAAAMVLIVTQGVALYRLHASRRENARLETRLTEHERALSSTRTSLASLEEQLRNRPAAPTVAQLNALQHRLAERSTPQLDVAIVDLDPQDGGVVRGSTDPQIVTTAPDAAIVTLILNFVPLVSRSTLEVEVTDDGAHTRWVGRTQRDRATATLTLALPSDGYPPGRYVIRLFDVTRGRRPLATYSVFLRHATARSR